MLSMRTRYLWGVEEVEEGVGGDGVHGEGGLAAVLALHTALALREKENTPMLSKTDLTKCVGTR